MGQAESESPARPCQDHRNRGDLARRVSDRLPGGRLADLAVELVQTARQTDGRTREARRPILAIRLASALAADGSLLCLWYLASHVQARWEFGTFTELFEAADAGFNLVVVLGGALWFLITLEARIKRRTALESIEELREFIHVIDVTQLYYTFQARPGRNFV
ncbi:MAG: hypothetical protein ACRERU_23620 [Methylococcales bacterium]